MTGLAADCAFCSPTSDRIVIEDVNAIVILDRFPVSEGHALIVPRQHVSSLFDLDANVQASIWKLLGRVREVLIDRHNPSGFNIGLNDGRAAGQTVDHAHIHVIPRYSGDVPDPRGGVRWVLPMRARYWSE